MTLVYKERMSPELPAEISQYITRALEEDIGPGDVTTNTIVPADASLRGRIVAKARWCRRRVRDREAGDARVEPAR